MAGVRQWRFDGVKVMCRSGRRPNRDLVQGMVVGDMVVLAALVQRLRPYRQVYPASEVRAAAVELAEGQVHKLRDGDRLGC